MATSAGIAVVTGGAGFIGSHLVERLVERDFEVVVVDDLSNGSEENLEPARRRGRVRLRVCDIRDRDSIAPLFDGADWVFHLAGRADIVPSIERPQDYHAVNVDGTVSVLEAARRAGVGRFVYAASSSCYGIPDVCPTDESAPIRPMYPYALTKNIGEQYVLHWHRVYRLPVVSLRLFNVFGPRAQTKGAYGGVFKVFLPQRIAGRPYTVVGDGEQTRDFVYVTDVAEAFVKAACSELTGEVFNVGCGRPTSVNELVGLLGGESVHLPERPGEPRAIHADIARIRAKLGWEPKVAFEQGVEEVLRNLEAWREAELWDEGRIALATRDWFSCLSGTAPAPGRLEELR